ncbi:unnamed protein product [Adineta ricciae]|uniref:G-protein coupled receptors family 1 profile domain-containing protein n=1 Tax=Adineta ricciae TaxID=249248 RepID=A0A814NR71_ADIRI|nr:unnamed protein product [Adineta ricciae]CAF1094842.1 unnamed protein product [Adineta ricciae]
MDYNLISTLLSVQQNLFKIGGPILIFLGVVSNLLSLTVFIQKNFRKNPCSIYFMAFNVSNLILIYGSLLPPVLEIGYNINHTAFNLGLCRLRLYVAFVFNCLCPSYLILASIDRVIMSSANANVRKYSTQRHAYILSISNAVSWSVSLIHVAIFSTIIELNSVGFLCYLQPGSYTIAVTIGSLAKEIITPTSMFILGLWTIKNVRRTRQAVVSPSGSYLHSLQFSNGNLIDIQAGQTIWKRNFSRYYRRNILRQCRNV